MRWPRRNRLSNPLADRLTFGLAVAAGTTAGSVLLVEVARLARRHLLGQAGESGDSGDPMHAAGRAMGAAGHATQETFAVVRQGYGAGSRQEKVLFNILNGFLGGFATMRISATGSRGGLWPAGTVRVSGRHIHHFIPGILLAFSSGASGLMADSSRMQNALAWPFGIGLGLTFDEAALLVRLRDVYWTREGILSLQVSFAAAAILGATILGLRILRRGEEQLEPTGVIPPPVVRMSAPTAVRRARVRAADSEEDEL